jgi:hypothetical protein
LTGTTIGQDDDVSSCIILPNKSGRRIAEKYLMGDSRTYKCRDIGDISFCFRVASNYQTCLGINTADARKSADEQVEAFVFPDLSKEQGHWGILCYAKASACIPFVNSLRHYMKWKWAMRYYINPVGGE